MGDGSGVVYTSDDVSALTQELHQVVQEQKIGEGYPSDYLYHQLHDANGDSVVTKVGDEYYAAWLKRDDGNAGAPFTDVVLLKAAQIQEIYNARPPGNPNVFTRTGEDVYINPNLQDGDPSKRIPADQVERVYYSVKDGNIVSADDALEANSRTYERNAAKNDLGSVGEPIPYSTALLPKAIIQDDHVSERDLTLEMSDYTLFPSLTAGRTENDLAKMTYEPLIAQDVGESAGALSSAMGNVHLATYTLESEDIVSKIDFLAFEEGLQPRTYTVEAAEVVTPGQSNNDFEKMMQSVIDSGPAVRDAPNPLAGKESILLSNSFRAISGYLASGPSGEQAAEEAVNNAIRLYPEHRDIIASYALAASQDHKVDAKPYMQEISQRALGGEPNNASTVGQDQEVAPRATTSAPRVEQSVKGSDETAAAVAARFSALQSSGYFSEAKVDEAMNTAGMDPASLTAKQKRDIIEQVRTDVEEAISAEKLKTMDNEAADKALEGMPARVEEALQKRLSDVQSAIDNHNKPENLTRIYEDAVARKKAEMGPVPTEVEVASKFSEAEQKMINQFVERMRPMVEANPAAINALKMQANGTNPIMDEAIRVLSEEMEAGTPAVNPGGGPSGP